MASFVNKTYKASGCHLFDIEITEKKPTNQQTKSIVSFLSSKQKSMSVESADADLPTELTSLGVVRPILVDWFNGKVSINNEEEAKQLLADLAKQAEES